MVERFDFSVVIMGVIGGGKSSCANALAQRTGIGGGMLFPESFCSNSETRDVDAEEVKVWFNEGNCYVRLQIVDTLGIGYTDVDVEEDLPRLAPIFDVCRSGINAVFFVFNGRFTSTDESAFFLLEKALFGKKFFDFVSIVRTHSINFENERAVKEDQNLLKSKNNHFASIRYFLRKPLIFVDVPCESFDIELRRRKASGQILLKHLIKHCQVRHKIPTMFNVCDRIVEYVKELKEIKEEERFRELLKVQVGENRQEEKEECEKYKREREEFQKERVEFQKELEEFHKERKEFQKERKEFLKKREEFQKTRQEDKKEREEYERERREYENKRQKADQIENFEEDRLCFEKKKLWRFLEIVGNNIGRDFWKFASAIGVSSAEVDEIEYNYPRDLKRIISSLMSKIQHKFSRYEVWKAMEEVCKALRDVERNDIVFEIDTCYSGYLGLG